MQQRTPAEVRRRRDRIAAAPDDRVDRSVYLADVDELIRRLEGVTEGLDRVIDHLRVGFVRDSERFAERLVAVAADVEAASGQPAVGELSQSYRDLADTLPAVAIVANEDPTTQAAAREVWGHVDSAAARLHDARGMLPDRLWADAEARLRDIEVWLDAAFPG